MRIIRLIGGLWALCCRPKLVNDRNGGCNVSSGTSHGPDGSCFRHSPSSDSECQHMFPSRVLWDAISQPFKQAQTGLYQGKMKQYGNNVPFSYKKTRRTWLPNVHSKRLPSIITDGMLSVKLTTRALRTIKKVCLHAPLDRFYLF